MLQILKLCAEKWKYMSDEEKEDFVEMEDQERERMKMRAVREEGREEEDSAEELSDEELAELTMLVHGNQEDDIG